MNFRIAKGSGRTRVRQFNGLFRCADVRADVSFVAHGKQVWQSDQTQRKSSVRWKEKDSVVRALLELNKNATLIARAVHLACNVGDIVAVKRHSFLKETVSIDCSGCRYHAALRFFLWEGSLRSSSSTIIRIFLLYAKPV